MVVTTLVSAVVASGSLPVVAVPVTSMFGLSGTELDVCGVVASVEAVFGTSVTTGDV